MLTERQQTVFDWLNNNLERPVYAAAYKGALDILNKKSAGYITFVSHAGRDLMNGLASAAIGISGAPVVQYIQRVNDFTDEWKDEWGGGGYNTIEDNNENGHLIPNEICKKIKTLIDEHIEGRLRAEEVDSSFFSTFLDYPDEESIPEDLSQEWEQAIKWFRGHAYLRENAFSIETYDEVEKHFQNLDSLLYAAAASEIEQLRNIHEILDKANR